MRRRLILEISDNALAADKMKNEVLPKSIAFIDECRSVGQRVLVHCSAGRSRSATVVAAWLMKEKDLNAKQAQQFIKKKRNIQLNQGFEKLLLHLPPS
jgi:protein-tyrosine phosphatase